MTATDDRLRRCQARRNRSGNRIAGRGPLPVLTLAALGWLAACSDSTSPGDSSELLGDPTVVATLDLPDGANGIIVRDGLAYVSQGGEASTLAVADVTDPKSPVILGRLGASGVPLAFALAGDRAYLASQAVGLQIVDVAHPAAPSLVGAYDQVHARGVAVASNRAYVTTGTCFVGADLVVVDVADPTNPAAVDSIPLPDCSPLPRGATLAGSIAYVWPAPALVGIDVRDPDAPVEVSRLPLAAGAPVGQVWIEGSLAYVTAWEGGPIEVFDVGDPTDPASLGSLEIPGVDFVYSPVVAGDELYVLTLTEEAGGVFVSGVEAIGVSDPAAPTRIGRVDLPPAAEEAGGLAIDGRYAYVTVDPRLYVIDLGRLAR